MCPTHKCLSRHKISRSTQYVSRSPHKMSLSRHNITLHTNVSLHTTFSTHKMSLSTQKCLSAHKMSLYTQKYLSILRSPHKQRCFSAQSRRRVGSLHMCIVRTRPSNVLAQSMTKRAGTEAGDVDKASSYNEMSFLL